MEIGRFYQGHSEYLAAINRFRTVIERYQTTTHVPEALHRLVECYLAMGIVDEAKATEARLGQHFPGSDWSIASHENGNAAGRERVGQYVRLQEGAVTKK